MPLPFVSKSGYKEKCKLVKVELDFIAAEKIAKGTDTKYHIEAMPIKADVSSHQALTN